MQSALASSLEQAALPTSATSAWRLVFVSHSDLPQSLQVLPTLFRLLAVALFVPVAALAIVDIVGYVAFALVLRPLGYASTRHFKDPENDARLMAIPLHGSIHSPSSTGDGVLPSSGESTSSGASDLYPSPAFSDGAPLPSVDEEVSSGLRARPGKPSGLGAVVTGATSFPSSSDSSSSTPHGRVSSAYRAPGTSWHGRVSSSESTASLSGDESSTLLRMLRDRAPSVGLDGPLFGEGDETDTATTPGAESDVDVDDARGDYLSHKPVRGDGVPRGGFKLGLTEVQRRPSVAQ